jgi:toxin ParE1/3/4
LKRRRLVFRPQAEADFDAIYDYIAEASRNFEVAFNFTERLRTACFKLVDFSERGTPRNDLFPGLRTVGFERKSLIVYLVQGDDVVIVNIFHGGRDWEAAILRDESLVERTDEI